MLQLQYSGHLMRKADSLEKTLVQVKIDGKRRKRWQRVKWLENTPNSMDVSLSKLGDREARCAAIHGIAKNRTQLRN